jgi:hypothetical protein
VALVEPSTPEAFLLEVAQAEQEAKISPLEELSSQRVQEAQIGEWLP